MAAVGPQLRQPVGELRRDSLDAAGMDSLAADTRALVDEFAGAISELEEANQYPDGVEGLELAEAQGRLQIGHAVVEGRLQVALPEVDVDALVRTATGILGGTGTLTEVFLDYEIGRIKEFESGLLARLRQEGAILEAIRNSRDLSDDLMEKPEW